MIKVKENHKLYLEKVEKQKKEKEWAEKNDGEIAENIRVCHYFGIIDKPKFNWNQKRKYHNSVRLKAYEVQEKSNLVRLSSSENTYIAKDEYKNKNLLSTYKNKFRDLEYLLFYQKYLIFYSNVLDINFSYYL